jgi:hypothetical protein
LKGTKILCSKHENEEEIYLPIEKLQIGMSVKTLGGFVKLVDIESSQVMNYNHSLRCTDRLYVYRKKDNADLFEDLIVTGGHSRLVSSITLDQCSSLFNFWQRVYMTEGKIRIPACLDEVAQPYQNQGEHTVYHIVLENENKFQNYGVYANGLLSESCSEFALETMREYNQKYAAKEDTYICDLVEL